jgi:hypothetical protein
MDKPLEDDELLNTKHTHTHINKYYATAVNFSLKVLKTKLTIQTLQILDHILQVQRYNV